MVIVKQELAISDVDPDDDFNGTDDDSYMDSQTDVPFIEETFFQTQSLVHDRPKVFECYLCHKSWPTVGNRFLILFV